MFEFTPRRGRAPLKKPVLTLCQVLSWCPSHQPPNATPYPGYAKDRWNTQLRNLSLARTVRSEIYTGFPESSYAWRRLYRERNCTQELYMRNVTYNKDIRIKRSSIWREVTHGKELGGVIVISWHVTRSRDLSHWCYGSNHRYHVFVNATSTFSSRRIEWSDRSGLTRIEGSAFLV